MVFKAKTATSSAYESLTVSPQRQRFDRTSACVQTGPLTGTLIFDPNDQEEKNQRSNSIVKDRIK